MLEKLGQVISNWAEWAVAITVLTSFIGAAIRWVIIPARKAYIKFNNAYHTFNNVAMRFQGVELDLKQIKSEVMPGDGKKSLRDELRETASGVVQLQAMFRANTELSSEASVICDATGEIVVVTAGYTNLTGLTTVEAMHGGWERAIGKEDLPEVRENWENSIKNGRTYVDDFKFVHTITGKITLVHVENKPVRLNNGVVVGFAARIKVLKGSDKIE